MGRACSDRRRGARPPRARLQPLPHRIVPSQGQPRLVVSALLREGWAVMAADGIPTGNPNFWADLARLRDATLANKPEPAPHEKCRKRPMRQLLGPESHGGCQECGLRKLQWMTTRDSVVQQAAVRRTNPSRTPGYNALLHRYGYPPVEEP